MFGLALLFAIVALVAAWFGFFGLAGTAAMIAQWIFVIALVLAVAVSYTHLTLPTILRV